MPTGIVYLITNPAMPGLVKIGITTQDDVQVRLAQLYTTSVPVPFECAYASRVNDPDKVEKALHTAFGPSRINPKREYFKIDVVQALSILKLLEIEDVTPGVNAQPSPVSEEEREAGMELTRRRPRINFVQMNIPVGSELVSKVTGENAMVISERLVRFRDEETSLSAATRLTLGIDYNVAPTAYWTFNGKSVQEIYDETYLVGE
jgi:hypothetical protein